MGKIIFGLSAVIIMYFVFVLFVTKTNINISDLFTKRTNWASTCTKRTDAFDNQIYFSLNNDRIYNHVYMPMFTGVVYSISIKARLSNLTNGSENVIFKYNNKLLTSFSVTNNVWHYYRKFFSVTYDPCFGQALLEIVSKNRSDSIDIKDIKFEIPSLYDTFKRHRIENDLYKTNLIMNGDFKDGLNHWEVWKSYKDSIITIITNYNYNAIRITNPQKRYVGFKQDIVISSGKVYRLSANIRPYINTNIYFGARISLGVGDNKYYLLWLNNNNWLRKELVFTNAISGKASLFFYLGYYNNNASADFSDIRLEEKLNQ
jgi:hypothetical protein